MSDKFYVGLDLTDIDDNTKMQPISRVTLHVDDEHEYTAGDDSGIEISADCIHATQSMANTILARLKGYQYQQFSATAVNLDPAAELGDGIDAGGLYGVISQISDDGNGYPDVEAPGEPEMEDEFPISGGPLTQTIRQNNAAIRSSITKTAEEIRLEVKEQIDDVGSDFSVKLDEITGRVTSAEGDIGSLKLTASGLETTVQAQDGRITTAQQTADKIGWIVKSGTSSSDFEMTERAINLVAQTINLSGFVTFTDLSTANTQTTINGSNITTGTIAAERVNLSAYSTTEATNNKISSDIQALKDGLKLSVSNGANSSTLKLQAGSANLSSAEITFSGLVNFVSKSDIYTSGKTTIDGGKITAGSINVDKLSVTDLSAFGATIGGWTINSNGIIYNTDDKLHRVTLRWPIQASLSTGVFYISTRKSQNDSWTHPFRVNGDGSCSATDFKISGKSVFSGTLNKPTGTLSNVGGTFTGTHSGGTISNTGGTFTGTNTGSLTGTANTAKLTSCFTGGSSLYTGASGSSTYLGNSNTSAQMTGYNINLRTGEGTTANLYPGIFTVIGSLSCTGEKPRIITTQHFGTRALCAFETPLPTFADYGTATISDDGTCVIYIDPVFAETIDQNYIPSVFLTKYGSGEIWVDSVEHDFFIVKGSPNLRFSWQTMYQQIDVFSERMMDYEIMRSSAVDDDYAQQGLNDIEINNVDYEENAFHYLEDFERSLIA